jgi:GNAT superfamily N-acetyltransferase
VGPGAVRAFREPAGASIQVRRARRWLKASIDGVEVGSLRVAPMPLTWADGHVVMVAGISSVGTEAAFRRRGVASRLLQEAAAVAIAEGLPALALSVRCENVARRVYARAGFVEVGIVRCFQSEGSCRPPHVVPERVELRSYEPARDLQEVMGLVAGQDATCFGSRQKALGRWEAVRSSSCSDFVGVVAVADGRIVGFADYRVRDRRPAAEVFSMGIGDRFALQAALVSELESRTRAKIAGLSFWTSYGADHPTAVLVARGYRCRASRAFMVNLLVLERLLADLGHLFRSRTGALAPASCPATMAIVCGGTRSVVEVGGTGPSMAIAATREVMTGVLCGVCSAWEAFLKGHLDVDPAPGQAERDFLQAIFPSVPFDHPVDDWW